MCAGHNHSEWEIGSDGRRVKKRKVRKKEVTRKKVERSHRCRDCAYFSEMDFDFTQVGGICRKGPPEAGYGRDVDNGYGFPLVDSVEDWCGELVVRSRSEVDKEGG